MTGTATERFLIEPYFRPAARYDVRNESVLGVRDGFMLTDTWTETPRHCPRKKDALAQIEATLAREAALDWSRIASFETPKINAGSGLGEVYGYDAAGRRIDGYLCMVSGRWDDRPGQVRARIRVWLAAVGHPGLRAR
jgi:hypothetical protein